MATNTDTEAEVLRQQIDEAIASKNQQQVRAAIIKLLATKEIKAQLTVSHLPRYYCVEIVFEDKPYGISCTRKSFLIWEWWQVRVMVE